MLTVAHQGLILHGKQHLAQELVLPLPVHMVHREPQHPLSDALARYLGEMRARLGTGLGTRDRMMCTLFWTQELLVRGVSTRDLYTPNPGIFGELSQQHGQYSSIPSGGGSECQSCHVQCGLRTSRIHYPLDLVRNAGPWGPPQTHEVGSTVS